MGLRRVEDSSDRTAKLLLIGYTMLLGKPVLPLVGVIQQITGISDTDSEAGGGGMMLGR